MPSRIIIYLLIKTNSLSEKSFCRYWWIKSSVIAEVDTNSWESAVDIMAATAPEIKRPASNGWSRFFAKRGIACSGSFIWKYSGPNNKSAKIPTKKAPVIPGIAQQIAIFLAIETIWYGNSI